MKEDNGLQDVGATAFDYPNGKHPGYENKIHYGPQHVPMPHNEKAEYVYKSKVMRVVLQGK